MGETPKPKGDDPTKPKKDDPNKPHVDDPNKPDVDEDEPNTDPGKPQQPQRY